MTREDWLKKLTDALRPDFVEIGSPIPEKVRSACGFPSKSALAAKTRRIGEAWSCESSDDKTFETFVSPLLGDAVEVAATQVHELVHCCVGLNAGHKGPFKAVAKAIGLEGKLSETHAGEKLKARLEELIAQIGPYPHAKLVHSNRPKKQTTRMLKVTCPDCGCICRMTAKWIEDCGCPTCACGGQMVADPVEGDDD
jgi:hypothetical protein